VGDGSADGDLEAADDASVSRETTSVADLRGGSGRRWGSGGSASGAAGDPPRVGVRQSSPAAEPAAGWTSWRDVSGQATGAALNALMDDPMSTARRLLAGPGPGPTVPRSTALSVDVASVERTTARLESTVSRETDDQESPPLEDLDDDGATVTGWLETGQTAARSGQQAIDGSTAMHEVSDITDWVGVRATVEERAHGARQVDLGPSSSWRPPGAPLPVSSPYTDEAQRQDLVGSLPLVDDSTPLAVQVAEDARRRISLVGRPFPAPPRTRVLTVANQKGGVGKTTTTVNVAAAMAQAGLTVLVLDIDPQGNASTALGIDHHAEVPSLYDVVVEGTPLADVLQPCPDVPNLWCAPATIDLAGAEIELVSMVARELRLQRALETYLGQRRERGLPQIDYVFVDCPPSLSLLTINAFVAAQEVFIPIQCEYYALEGLSQLLKHIDLIRGHLNPTLHVSTMLLTMYDGRTRLSAQVADEVRNHFSDLVVRTTVPRSVRISEAPSHSQTVMTYDPASSGALSYLEAARELAEQVLTWTPRATHEEQE
jgi:chromosome partitioning protein